MLYLLSLLVLLVALPVFLAPPSGGRRPGPRRTPDPQPRKPGSRESPSPLPGFTAPPAPAEEYETSGPLLSPAERSFFGVLQLVTGDNTQIFPKVRLADVIKPRRGGTRSRWQTGFNKISAKHLDFLICRSSDLKPLLAIELNDRSHAAGKRADRDSFLARALSSAGLPLVFIPARSGYSPEKLRKTLAPYLPEAGDERSRNQANAVPENTHAVDGEHPLCPLCSSPLTRQAIMLEGRTVKEYLACSAYPDCRYTQPLGRQKKRSTRMRGQR